MFITSVRVNTLKIAAVLLALGVIIAAAVWPRSVDAVQAGSGVGSRYAGISTNEKRVEFLTKLGWKVDQNPIEVVEVTIPQVFGSVYKNYNGLQKKQGFDLSRYRGQRVKRWTYRVRNYPGVTDEVRANLLIYNNTVIGGDISTVALNGFMKGLIPEQAAAAESGVSPQDADITENLFTEVKTQ